MKNKLLCSVCVAMILALSLGVLAAAAHMNLTSMEDVLPPPAGTDNENMPNDTNNNMTDMLPGEGNGILNDMMPNDTENSTDTNNATNNDTTTNDESNGMPENGTTNIGETDGIGDVTSEMPMPETNVPDDDIGGAVGDNDHDNVPDAVDSDDDNDGIKDPLDSDANGDGVDDEEKTTGIVGIVIAVVAVIAVIAVVIAVMPKKNKN